MALFKVLQKCNQKSFFLKLLLCKWEYINQKQILLFLWSGVTPKSGAFTNMCLALRYPIYAIKLSPYFTRSI